MRGLEPLAARLQVECATNCATPAGFLTIPDQGRWLVEVGVRLGGRGGRGDDARGARTCGDRWRGRLCPGRECLVFGELSALARGELSCGVGPLARRVGGRLRPRCAHAITDVSTDGEVEGGSQGDLPRGSRRLRAGIGPLACGARLAGAPPREGCPATPTAAVPAPVAALPMAAGPSGTPRTAPAPRRVHRRRVGCGVRLRPRRRLRLLPSGVRGAETARVSEMFGAVVEVGDGGCGTRGGTGRRWRY